MGHGLEFRDWSNVYPRKRRRILRKPRKLFQGTEWTGPYIRLRRLHAQRSHGGRWTCDGSRRQIALLWLPCDKRSPGKTPHAGEDDAWSRLRALPRICGDASGWDVAWQPRTRCAAGCVGITHLVRRAGFQFLRTVSPNLGRNRVARPAGHPQYPLSAIPIDGQ